MRSPDSLPVLTVFSQARTYRRLSRSRILLPQTPRKKHDLWVGILVILWATGVCLPRIATPAETAAERASTKIIIAYSSISGNMAPLWITHEKGLFRKYGLDVQIVLVEGGSRAAQSLASGEVAFAQMSG